MDELARLEPRELLHPDSDDEARSCLTHLRGPRLCAQPSASFNPNNAAQLLQTQFAVQSLDGFGCRGLTAGIGAAGAVLRYFRETQPTASLAHLRRLHRRAGAATRCIWTVRRFAISNSYGHWSPVSPDRDRTSRRSCRYWTAPQQPWAVACYESGSSDRSSIVSAIQARLDAVGELKDRIQQRVSLRTTLRDVQDIARLSSRVTLGVAGPRELLALKQSVSALPELRSHLQPFRRLVTGRCPRVRGTTAAMCMTRLSRPSSRMRRWRSATVA